MDRDKVLGGSWLAFSQATPEPAAVARFQEKHGHAPAEVIQDRGLLLIGPLAEREDPPASSPPTQARLPGAW